jgi:single-strand DNA-binding protein
VSVRKKLLKDNWQHGNLGKSGHFPTTFKSKGEFMSSMNNVSLIGRLTREPELRYTASGKAVSSFGIAINEKYKSGDDWKTDVCFIEITAWEKTAEACSQYLKKGSLCGVVGKLKYDTWESEDGKKNNKLSVVGKQIIFLDPKESEDAGS